MKPWIKRLLLGLVAAALVIGVLAGFGIRSTLKELPDAYAIWGTGELVIAHLEKTGELPVSWAQLEPLWQEGYGTHARSADIQAIGDLKKRVTIDFDRLEEHRNSAIAGSAPDPLITATSGATTRWQGADADEMIVRYLAGETAP